MKKLLLSIIFAQIIIIHLDGQIIDHKCTKLSSIPSEWINKAKTDLHIAYGHLSHGSQLTDGMTGLYAWKGDLYAWNEGGTGGALDLDDNAFTGASTPANPNRTAWAASTRTYLSSNPDVNVVIWSWCDETWNATESDINTYLSLMTGLENDYPNVKFVYMTSRLFGQPPTYNGRIRNKQIRDYCIANNKILYDFEDISMYDPDGISYESKLPSDACNYDYDGDGVTEQTGDPATPTGGDRNWALDWASSHTENVDWYNCTCAHSWPVDGNQKAYAAWWLWARLAGWDGN